jgi:hypothetical protein
VIAIHSRDRIPVGESIAIENAVDDKVGGLFRDKLTFARYSVPLDSLDR